jgi:hypothetical protein
MRWAIALALLAACGGSNRAPQTVPRDVEVLLDAHQAMEDEVGALIPDFDVSGDQRVVVADADHLYVVGPSGAVAVEGIGGADSFAYTRDGLLMVVRGTQLLYLSEEGTLELLVELPNPQMGIATGPAGGMYLFDQYSDDGTHALYQLMPGKAIAKILESPSPILSVAQASDHVLFVADGTVFEASPGRPLRMVVRLAETAIRSVAADADRIYFADDRTVYAMADDGFTVVTDKMGGNLRVRGGALLVLDPSQPKLVRLAPKE